MTTWKDLDLTTINPGFDTVPASDYTYSIRGAKYNQWDANKIDVSATIVTENDFTGRVLFFSYPDPAKQEWSPKVFKRLEQALGVDMLPGQDPVEYLNQNAGLRFAAPVKHRQIGDDKNNIKAEVDIFKVRAAN